MTTTATFRVVVRGQRTAFGSLAYVAAHARAAALADEVVAVIDATGEVAAVRRGVAGGFVVIHEPALVLFPIRSGEPSWLSRLIALLAEHG